jgi:hypothetical protein
MYPSTARCDESNASVCSSSGDMPGVGVGAAPAIPELEAMPLGCGIDDVRVGAWGEFTG